MTSAPSYRITGGGLTATVVPSRGGKIVSLLGAGREWLTQPTPGGSPLAPRFVDHEMAGWDECAPSIDACTIDGHEIPDHGDLWSARWDVTESSPESLGTRVVGSSLGYTFTRLISGTPGALRLDYEASAGRGRTPFLWAGHPQFAAPAGTHVVLEPSVTSVVDVLGETDTEVPWDSSTATIDTVAVGGCRKVYVTPGLAVTAADLVLSDGSRLRMRWTGCDYLGLWYDHAAFSQEPVIAIEPSTGFRDSLAIAAATGRAATLAPGRPLRWSVELSLEN